MTSTGCCLELQGWSACRKARGKSIPARRQRGKAPEAFVYVRLHKGAVPEEMKKQRQPRPLELYQNSLQSPVFKEMAGGQKNRPGRDHTGLWIMAAVGAVFVSVVWYSYCTVCRWRASAYPSAYRAGDRPSLWPQICADIGTSILVCWSMYLLWLLHLIRKIIFLKKSSKIDWQTCHTVL